MITLQGGITAEKKAFITWLTLTEHGSEGCLDETFCGAEHWDDIERSFFGQLQSLAEDEEMWEEFTFVQADFEKWVIQDQESYTWWVKDWKQMCSLYEVDSQLPDII